MNGRPNSGVDVERRFKLAPGTEVVPVAEGRYTLRSEFEAVELSGDAASDLAENVLRILHEPLGLTTIEQLLPGYSSESIVSQLEALVDGGLLVEVSDGNNAAPRPMAALFQSMGSDPEGAADALRTVTVAVYGLEAHGAHLARMLAEMGVGTIRLVDPFPFERGHLDLTPVTDPGLVGSALQDAISELLAPFPTRVEKPTTTEIDPGIVRELLEGCDLAFACWDQGYGAATHWLNRAALETGVSVLFSELRATTSLAGPLYLPSRSACWMCYRMRAVARAPDFEQAIAFEEHLDRVRRPRLASRATIPILSQVLASTMALEAFRVFTGLHPATLVDNVSEFDGVTSTSEIHPVLKVPSCPVCSKKKERVQPSFDKLIRVSPSSIDLPRIAERLVDTRTGVVAQFGAVPRDPSEVPIPLVWRATLANHRFLSEHDEDRATCSGKGMTKEEAWASCLGEAVERYSGACWGETDLTVAPRIRLNGRALDPCDLVLYRDDQYASLPYVPYHDEAELAWVQARSLVFGDEVWIPATSVFMDYAIQSPSEYLFPITSNGLAAGPTLHDAVVSALSEVLERDAMLITWLNLLPGHTYDPAVHPDADVRRLARLYERRGVDLSLIELVTDHPFAVFFGVALYEGVDGPAAAVGLGASLDPISAARKAALEVGQVRPSIRRRARMSAEKVDELVADPLTVTTMEDHALLYSHPSTVDEFRFLFGSERSWENRQPANAKTPLGVIIEHFSEVGQDVLYVNLTPEDMASLGVHTARVIVPGFQPIWFGRHERRLGGRRLFDFPMRQGLRDGVAGPDDLNPMPHPIA